MGENLYLLLRCGFAAAPSRPVLQTSDGCAIDWTALDDLSARLSAVLASRGVAEGDRVVAQVDKSAAAFALYLACLRRGALYVPLNTAYTDAEVASLVADAEPRVFVRSSVSREVRAAFVEELGTGADSPLWREARSTSPDPYVAARAAGDAAAIVYTSGTTGRAKGAVLSHGNLADNAKALAAVWQLRASDVLLHALPIYHVHGLFIAMHSAMVAGATTIFLPRFDANEVKRLLPRATVMMGVPTFYTRLLALEGFGQQDCARMRLFVSGSAPLLATTHHSFAERTGHCIVERYGMTETGILTSNGIGDAKAGSVGFALPGVQFRIVNEDGIEARPGQAGVLEVAGTNVFGGYWRMPERRAVDFRDDGYFVTGDVATCDDDGRITLVGRARDLVISGGLNIYPKEIEEVLDAVPGVVESAVFGVPDADFGEAVFAVVATSHGSSVTVDELMGAVRRRLARFKHPRRIELVGELPRNAMGKVLKNVLRERYARQLA
ncbi:MAG TPA: AMP-binding protein [Candidatus Binatia bacterium]